MFHAKIEKYDAKIAEIFTLRPLRFPLHDDISENLLSVLCMKRGSSGSILKVYVYSDLGCS